MASPGISSSLKKGITWKIQPKAGETPDEVQEASMKTAASINMADFCVPLKPPQINQEISYSDLVPNNQRVLLRDQVIEEEVDDPLFSSTNIEDRPPLKQDTAMVSRRSSFTPKPPRRSVSAHRGRKTHQSRNPWRRRWQTRNKASTWSKHCKKGPNLSRMKKPGESRFSGT